MFQRCGNSVVGNNPNTRNIGSGDPQEKRKSIVSGNDAYNKTPSMRKLVKLPKYQNGNSENKQSVKPAARNNSVWTSCEHETIQQTASTTMLIVSVAPENAQITMMKLVVSTECIKKGQN